MDGAALAEKKRFDLALVAAWHTEAFARSKRLPKLDKLIGADALPPSPSLKHAQAVAFFRRLQAKGVPVTITKNQIN